jgi:hypothetical protein
MGEYKVTKSPGGINREIILSDALSLHFSHNLNKTIWKTVADVESTRLFLEVRDVGEKMVSFYCLDISTNTWILSDYKFEEQWWISLQACSGDIALFTHYSDNNNPDKKMLFAFSIRTQTMIWWKNDFSLSVLAGRCVIGLDTKFGSKEVALNLLDGQPIQKDFTVSYAEQNFNITRPFQYHEGSQHFDTVKAFLELKTEISPIITIEYCEYHSLILISAFTGREDLANYLFVFNSNGEMLTKETLGVHLKGIALDTFFVFSGFLIFVKNKCELVSYKIL